MLSLREPRHGKLVTITGPVKSGKETYLVQLLNSANKTIWRTGKRNVDNIVLAKHPGVKNPGKIGSYEALKTDNPDDIADLVKPGTEAVVISGINFFEDLKIVNLLQGIVMSNRRVYVAGHNLDWNGRPFNFMPQIMALSDGFILTKAPCMAEGCQLAATRSSNLEGIQRVCIDDHIHFDERPEIKPVLKKQTGNLELFVGNMYASKSTVWRERMRELDANGIDYAIFKWIEDKRYSEEGRECVPFGRGHIGFNNSDEKIPAVIVRDMHDILMYLEGRTPIKEINEMNRKRKLGHIFIDEGQFIEGIYKEVRTRMYKGYKFYITGLMRNYKMEPFKEIADLLTIADNIGVMHAYCEVCGREASESQRLVKKKGKWVPAHYTGDEIVVGGKGKGESVKEKYQARCRDCTRIPGVPKQRYKFQKYTPPRSRKDAIKAMKEMQQ